MPGVKALLYGRGRPCRSLTSVVLDRMDEKERERKKGRWADSSQAAGASSAPVKFLPAKL